MSLLQDIVMTKPGVPRLAAIKAGPHQVSATHIHTNLNTAGMSRERFLELLEQVR